MVLSLGMVGEGLLRERHRIRRGSYRGDFFFFKCSGVPTFHARSILILMSARVRAKGRQGTDQHRHIFEDSGVDGNRPCQPPFPIVQHRAKEPFSICLAADLISI